MNQTHFLLMISRLEAREVVLNTPPHQSYETKVGHLTFVLLAGRCLPCLVGDAINISHVENKAPKSLSKPDTMHLLHGIIAHKLWLVGENIHPKWNTTDVTVRAVIATSSFINVSFFKVYTFQNLHYPRNNFFLRDMSVDYWCTYILVASQGSTLFLSYP